MRFNPLPATAVSRFLGEQRGMDRQKASLLAGLSGGSVGRALELDQEDIAAYRAEIMQLLMKARKDDPISLLNLVSNFGQDKRKIKQGMDIISSCFRDALILKETHKAEMLLNADHPSFINTLVRRLSGEQILQNIFLVARAWGTIELNVNKTLTLETMAFKLNI
jgi:DNA polymerase-3 subunit delta'